MYVVTASHFLFQQPSSPFRRVREEEIEVDARVADNSFEAKVGLGGARVETVALWKYTVHFMSAEQPRCVLLGSGFGGNFFHQEAHGRVVSAPV